METREADQTADSVSIRVVEALAAANDTDPMDMEPPLYEAVDPEALDRLFEHGVDCHVTFEYNGHTVDVRNGGTVSIDETTDDDAH